MAVRFDDSKFRASHMVAPKGRGSWAFEFEGDVFFSPSWMSFAEARKWAKDAVKRRGFQDAVVFVMP